MECRTSAGFTFGARHRAERVKMDNCNAAEFMLSLLLLLLLELLLLWTLRRCHSASQEYTINLHDYTQNRDMQP
jgi:flagellar biogenesis protein FliO